MKYKLTLAFDGAPFSGWQAQNNAPTVQKELTECVRRVLGDNAQVTGASRTDSGVHALGFVCHVTAEKKLPCESVIAALNHFLDPHIAVLSCEEAPDDFHARYSAVSKEYHYVICDGGVRDPFLNGRAWFVPYTLDVDKMNTLSKELVGSFDFTSFMASGSKIEDARRTVFSSEVTRCGNRLEFSVSANGFLYNMVRIMTGTLVDACRGKITEPISEIIAACDRSRAGVTAPAQGLYLYRVNY